MARVLLRMPDALLKQIDVARAEAEREAGWAIDRTQFVLRLITEGLTRVGRRRSLRVPAVKSGPAAEDLGFDTSRYVLGKLCRQGHAWGDTGQSLLYKGNRSCVECHRVARRKG